MADAFLRELFQVQNRVQNDEDQKCIICMDDCGTIRPENGLAEFAIRLPCYHIVGSGCINQWLRSNNTCPMCRHVFFPAQSQPDLEQDVRRLFPQARPDGENSVGERQLDLVHSNRPQGTREQIINGPIDGLMNYILEIKHACDHYCGQLSLNTDIAQFAATVATNLLDPRPSNDVLQRYSDACIIALSVYIASMLTGLHRSPMEILAVMDNVSTYDIREAYEDLTDSSNTIDAEIRSELEETFSIRSSVWPPYRSGLESREAGLLDVGYRCSAYCAILGLSVSDNVHLMADKIASRVWNIGSLRQLRRSPRSLAAACVYMAGYLMGTHCSLRGISRASEASVVEIDEVYWLLAGERRHIVQECWLRIIGVDDMRSAFELLPAV